MAELLVQFGQLQAAAGHIDSAISALHTQLDDLGSAAKPLVATWNGAAQDAYQQRQQQWTRAAQDLTNILQNIKKALEESTQEYIQTEKTNTSLFAG
ncbi:WXG100 family type VII secretion target [Planosporangium thailandense]|uniref:ESAT-6-like protein n=1 Tax=Planosporangium thailandense TaxID=765197 RepID=A0ABX0Y1F4_9ACTN|nr:WXG100 family type VII secretion target [Planosporangium thailandense]NJC71921.1 WXG100 family type VII secretion target [Planosporangium thailandense]NJC74350.1 WXG100 family type VII secretion target [Planosporangium thailandense]